MRGGGDTEAAPSPTKSFSQLYDKHAGGIEKQGRLMSLGLEPDEEEPEPPPDEHHKAAMLNGTLMARWAPDSRLMLVMEFVKERKLFAELNEFLQRKRR